MPRSRTLVASSPQVMLLAIDFHEDFINEEGIAITSFTVRGDYPEPYLKEMVFTEQKGTKVHIDFFNGILIENKDELINIGQAGETLILQGWAFDSYLETQAEKLVFTVNDGLPREALYGVKRPDVAKAFRNAKLLDIGFEIHILVSELSQKNNSVHIMVVSTDGNTYSDFRKIMLEGI